MVFFCLVLLFFLLFYHGSSLLPKSEQGMFVSNLLPISQGDRSDQMAKKPFYGCAPHLMQLAKGGSGAGIMSLPRRLLQPLGSAGMSEWVEDIPKQGSGPCGGGVHPRLTRAERQTFLFKSNNFNVNTAQFTLRAMRRASKVLVEIPLNHPIHKYAHNSIAESY